MGRRRAGRAPPGTPRAAGDGDRSGSAVAVRTYAFRGFEPVALLDGGADVAVVECDQVGQPRLAVDRGGDLCVGGGVRHER